MHILCLFNSDLTRIYLYDAFTISIQFNSQNLCNTSASPPVVFKIQYRTNVTLDDGNYVARLLHKPVMNLYINEQITTSFGISDPPPQIMLFQMEMLIRHFWRKVQQYLHLSQLGSSVLVLKKISITIFPVVFADFSAK